MTRRTVGLISIVLVLVIGFGTLISVPAVRADTTAHVSVTDKAAHVSVTDKAASVADKAAADVKLAALKTLGQQIREAAKAVWEKAKAAKDAKKDLSAFKEDLKTVKEDLKTVFKSRHNLRHNIQRMRKPQLTEAERTQLKAIESRALELRKQLKAKIHAKAPQVEIDALKAQLKAVIAEREALVKTFRASVRARYLGHLDNLIAQATKDLAFLQGLLARLP